MRGGKRERARRSTQRSNCRKDSCARTCGKCHTQSFPPKLSARCTRANARLGGDEGGGGNMAAACGLQSAGFSVGAMLSNDDITLQTYCWLGQENMHRTQGWARAN